MVCFIPAVHLALPEPPTKRVGVLIDVEEDNRIDMASYSVCGWLHTFYDLFTKVAIHPTRSVPVPATCAYRVDTRRRGQLSTKKLLDYKKEAKAANWNKNWYFGCHNNR